MHLEPCALLITDHLARERASLLPGFSESTLGTFNAQLGRGEMVLIIELDKRQRQIYMKAGECKPSRVTSVSGRLSDFEPRPAQSNKYGGSLCGPWTTFSLVCTSSTLVFTLRRLSVIIEPAYCLPWWRFPRLYTEFGKENTSQRFKVTQCDGS